jgi:GT2 family glycosyltransferase
VNVVGPPKVLIVVPTLGTRPDYLDMCLDSLAAQSYPRLDVVLVGPADGPVPRHAARRGLFFVPEPRPGIGAAINAGWLQHGGGAELWGWLGDDDRLPPDSVARVVAAMRGRNAVMAFGQCRYVDEAGRELWVAKPTSLAARNLGGGVDLVPQPGMLASAEAVRRVGMVDEDLRYAMDYDLFLRLREVGRLVYVPHVLAEFRWHEGSLTAAADSGSEAEAADVRRRHRRGRTASLRGRLEPLTLKFSKLHWHLQRRPLRLMLGDLKRSLR